MIDLVSCIIGSEHHETDDHHHTYTDTHHQSVCHSPAPDVPVAVPKALPAAPAPLALPRGSDTYQADRLAGEMEYAQSRHHLRGL
jgi:hypothetical protein